MRQETVSITAKQRRKLHHWLNDILKTATVRCTDYPEVVRRIREVGGLLGLPWAVKGPTQPAPEGYFAACRQLWYQNWFRDLGLDVVVPKPDVLNSEFFRRSALPLPQKLYGRIADYEVFMAAVGQGGDWTVTDVEAHKTVQWNAIKGFEWFWGEASPGCPRLRTPWNKLVTHLSGPYSLLWLEQYTAMWHAEKVETGVMLDHTTWCLLRTRFGRSVLRASEAESTVKIYRSDNSDDLAMRFARGGGRAVEVITSAV